MVEMLRLTGIWLRSLIGASVRERTVRKSLLCYILCNLDKFFIAPVVNFATESLAHAAVCLTVNNFLGPVAALSGEAKSQAGGELVNALCLIWPPKPILLMRSRFWVKGDRDSSQL
jgi:hypothetical protein